MTFSILELPERLDTINAPVFDKEVQACYAANNSIIFDFSKCTYLSSSGIRVLVKTKKFLIPRGGEVVLVNLQASVQQVLEMTGLLSHFVVCASCKDAEQYLVKQSSIEQQEVDGFSMQSLSEEDSVIWSWDDALTDHDELGIALGNGVALTTIDSQTANKQPVAVIGNLIVYPELSDFMAMTDDRRCVLSLAKAYSTNNTPKLLLHKVIASFEEIETAVKKTVNTPLQDAADATLILIMSDDATTLYNVTDSSGVDVTLDKYHHNSDLEQDIKQNLTFDNITGVFFVDKHRYYTNPWIYVFTTSKVTDAEIHRLAMNHIDGLDFEPYEDVLARRIYKQEGIISIKKLSGGYSARTYQVKSFDEEGRQLRPTVFKVASRDLIKRESDRCQQYALPYIFNNSAKVLGTEFFDTQGALCYNFVGVGGEKNELRWLHDDFFNLPIEGVSTLMDKIFCQILKPWYGQTIPTDINLYKEHDPTLTFFPQIAAMAEAEFGISSDSQFIYIEELGREIINPYWYLKTVYPKRYDFTYDYPQSICHGDLNMRNIMLDNDDNVYIIDFSEIGRAHV